jgi:GNAT superfamily N-acetyltransferase
MPGGIEIRRLKTIGEREIQGLSDVLIDCVEGGASVSFMLPMSRAKANAFWQSAAASAARGERVVLAAEDAAGTIVGTAQVILQQPENQPHRGDLVKMLVHRRARRRGVGAALLAAAESSALEAGKTLLVLDTASDDAERLYARGGWQRCGQIPNYALMPDGTPCPTTIYFKFLRESSYRVIAPTDLREPKSTVGWRDQEPSRLPD